MALGALALWLVWTPEPLVQLVEPPGVSNTAPAPVAAGPTPAITYEGKSGAIWALTFIDTDNLVIGMEDGHVKIWNRKTGEVKKTLEPQQGGTIWSAELSADGKYLVTACDDSRVTVWRLDTYEVLRSFPQPTSTKAAVFGPVPEHLAAGDRRATVRLWHLDHQIPIDLYGHRGTVHALAWSPDGNRLASTGSEGTVKLWNLRDIDWTRREQELPVSNLAEHKGPVYGVTFSADGKTLASTGWDGHVRIWDAATGEQKRAIKAHDGDAWSVSFGNDGKWVASAGQDAVKVFEVETGKELFSYRAGRAFHVVRFAKDGTTLAAGGRDGTVRVWELPR
jgi:WD40 repeat protein